MKKILVCCFAWFCFSHTAVHGQSAYQLVKVAQRIQFTNASMANISSYIRAPITSALLAEHVALLRKPTAYYAFSKNYVFSNKRGHLELPEVHIVAVFPAPILNSPSTLWGSYHYLRVLTSLSRRQGAVNPKFEKEWKSVFQIGGYNGVHHIVNKSTLKTIYQEMKRKAIQKGEVFTVNLDELQREAPGSLHPFHGRPEYSVLFHNVDRQLDLYRQGGIRAIVTDYFNELQRIHQMYPQKAPQPSQEVVNNTLLEAQLWSETFGLRWQ